MKRRKFLSLFGKSAVVVTATPLIVTGLAEMIAVKQVQPKFTEKMLMDIVADVSAQPAPEFTLYTGRQGMYEFNKAMKEFALEQEHKMMYRDGIKFNPKINHV